MIQFSLLGFPVRVHWSFWLVSALMSGAMFMGGRSAFLYLATWVAAAFVSILWHELGHAQAHRKFGGFAEIHLYSMGGLCVGRGRNSYTRQESMWISAAGPGASIFLFGIALAINWFTPIGERSDLGRLLIHDLLFINGFWTVLNLLPVLPLDGGQIFQAFMANKNPRLPVQVGMVVAILVAVWAFSIGQWPLAIFFGYLAHSNWQRGQGTHHGFW